MHDEVNKSLTISLSDQEGSTLFRALLEYRKALQFSSLKGDEAGVIAEELQRVHDLSERVSLAQIEAHQ